MNGEPQEQGESSCTPTAFVEKDRVMSFIASLVGNAAVGGPPIELRALELFLIIVLELIQIDQYQEIPQILDPYLEDMIGPIQRHLITLILNFDAMHQAEKSNVWEMTGALFKTLYRISKTRGHKVMVKFFDHDVAYLEPCLEFLEFATVNPKYQHSNYWEIRFIMLLWISLITMTPFDLTRLDSNKAQGTLLVDRIMAISNHYLCSAGVEYYAASRLVMRLLTRKDFAKTLLLPYIFSAVKELSSSPMFKVILLIQLRGTLLALCAILKYGPRDVLVNTVELIPVCAEMLDNQYLQTNGLLRKLLVKLCQRIALCGLKPKIASWRYQRGSRSLLDNLGHTVPTEAMPVDVDEDEGDIPLELDQIVELLLTGLSDKDTGVRWISAKGVGRIAARLPFDLADQIVESVIGLLEYDCFVADGIESADVSSVSDCTWHGCCLALAELSRRGLLLPTRLAQTIPWVLRALRFEQRRGQHSIGANVRDASCYILWSFARAYEPTLLQPHSIRLAQGLLVAAICDREINVRRAASAAFQENVGRHGLFPHGIDVIPVADYFTLGNINSAYIHVAGFAAQFQVYRIPIVHSMLVNCGEHWDKSIRQLCASGLGNICRMYPDSEFMSLIVPKMVMLDNQDKRD